MVWGFHRHGGKHVTTQSTIRINHVLYWNSIMLAGNSLNITFASYLLRASPSIGALTGRRRVILIYRQSTCPLSSLRDNVPQETSLNVSELPSNLCPCLPRPTTSLKRRKRRKERERHSPEGLWTQGHKILSFYK